MRSSICHIITGLGRAGAESFLLRLIQNLKTFDHHVIVLGASEDPEFTREFESVAHVTFLNMKPSLVDFMRGTFRLRHLMRDLKPQVVQGWMYHGNLLALTAGLAQNIPVLWNIRNGPMEASDQHKLPLTNLTNWVIKVGALLSFMPKTIICCSQNAARIHQGWGYRGDKFQIIPNGVDLKRFQVSPEKRAEARTTWGISSDQKVIGFVGRFHPQKDIPTFLHALDLVCAQEKNVMGVMQGRGLSLENPEMHSLLERFPNLKGHIKLMGPRSDVENIYPGFDVMCSSSAFGEAFPNVLAEAMACGIPCAATDVGDADVILGDQGLICGIKNPEELAENLRAILKESQKFQESRKRIQENFSLEKCLESYQKIYAAS